jgi:hypothetical protein
MSEFQETQDLNQVHENGVLFNMGKSYGLANKYGEIQRHRNSLQQLRRLSLEQLKRLMEEHGTQCKAVRKEMNSFDVDREHKFNKILESIPDLMRVYRKKLDNELSDNERLKKKADELYQAVEDGFNQDWEIAKNVGNRLEQFVANTEQKLQSGQQKLVRMLDDFAEKLEAMHINLDEMERGYWYGNAIRIALNK